MKVYGLTKRAWNLNRYKDIVINYTSEHPDKKLSEYSRLDEETFGTISNIPFVLKNCDIFEKNGINWSFNFFYKNYGNLELEITHKDENNLLKQTTILRDFIKNSIFSKRYDLQKEYSIHSWLFELQAPELLDHYDVPKYLINWFEGLEEYIRPKIRFIFMGKSNTGTSFHTEPMDTGAWNYLIEGEKVWFFLEPDTKAKVGDYLKFRDLLNVENILKLNPIVHIQKMGELIYIPSKWWHAVYNTENYLALSENFMNKYNYINVLEYLKTNNRIGFYNVYSNYINKISENRS